MQNPNRKEDQDFEAIKNFLQQSRDGATIEEISQAVGLNISLRTLQRRLSKLQQLGLITKWGDSRSTRYRLSKTNSNDKTVIQTSFSLIPLTEESENVLSVISRPESQRIPVGYHREFLEFYEPNATSYLTSEETKRLFTLGQIAASDQAAGTYAKEILQRLIIDLSYNSSRLEGNTYSLLDTERLIRLGEVADSKSALEAQMILNHKDAIEFIVNSAEELELNRHTILNLHALLANNLLPDPAAPGRLRNIGVGIGRSVYIPLAIPQLIEEMFELMLKKARLILNPFEQAFFIMVHLPYLQPFEDINKRVSRLAANIALNSHNLVPLSFVDVPGEQYTQGLLAIYELNRVELLKNVFLWAYERSSFRYATARQSVGEPDLFRLKYRQAFRSLINQVISRAMDKKTANHFIKNNVGNIPEIDRSKLIEYVETELLALHEGNFARYYISPAEFAHWKLVWDNS